MLLHHLTRWVAQSTIHRTLPLAPKAPSRCGTIVARKHFVLNDFDEERIIQRVTVVGDVPEAASPPRWAPYGNGYSVGATGRHDRQLNAFLKRRTRSLETNRRGA